MGYNSRGTISNSYATGSVSSVSSSSSSDAGGLVGNNAGGNDKQQLCHRHCLLLPPPPLSSYAGGLVGLHRTGGTISNSYATGSVTSAGVVDSYAGGLVGHTNGTISGTNYFVDNEGGIRWSRRWLLHKRGDLSAQDTYSA